MYLGILPNRDFALGALSGSMASSVAVMAAHPIETVKVRMQTAQLGGQTHLTSWRRFCGLIRNPYYGIAPHFMQYSAFNSIRFGCYAASRAFFERQARSRGRMRLHLGEVFMCGAFAGLGCSSLHPLLVVKTHQQMNRIGLSETVQKLWRAEGLQGLYRGYASALVRFPIGLGVFFAFYEGMKEPDLWTGHREPIAPAELQCDTTSPPGISGWIARAGSGGCAGIACWTSIYPLDVVQTRMMGEAEYGCARTYRGACSSFVNIYRMEGIGAFVRGYSAVLARAGGVNAILFPVNDAITPFLDGILPVA